MKDIPFNIWVFITTCACTIVLFVAGFIIPPPGEIHTSVLQAATILLGFAIAAQLPEVIRAGKSAKITIGGEHGVKYEVNHEHNMTPEENYQAYNDGEDCED